MPNSATPSDGRFMSGMGEGLGLGVRGLGVGLGLGNQAAISRESNEGVHNLEGVQNSPQHLCPAEFSSNSN